MQNTSIIAVKEENQALENTRKAIKMSGYNRKMLKKVNHKVNAQAYPYPMPNGTSNGGPGVAMKQESYSSPNNARGVMPNNQGFQGGRNPMSSPAGMPMKKGGKQDNSFSHKAPSLATDLHCYFQCAETFKKDFDLRLHLRLRHKHEDPNELKRAHQAAEDEISFVRRSGSKFECAICSKTYFSDGSMADHAKKAHDMTWNEYKEKYGRCEVESAPFECKICGSVIKYTTNVVHSHIKRVHGLNWLKYLDRIREMARGEEPEPLPEIERFVCGICNATVKYLSMHVSQVHKISDLEYGQRMEQLQQGLIPDELPMIETYDCQICSATVKNLMDHVWRVHHLTESDYQDRCEKMQRGEDPGALPTIENTECKICNMSAKGFREHIRRCHKITLAEYEELFG